LEASGLGSLIAVCPAWKRREAMWYVVTPRYISTSLKPKLRNNIDVTDYFAGDNEIYE